jgi:porin
VKGASGIYFIADQSIINESGNPEQGLGAMLQMGYSPYKSSINDFYMAYGINYTGLIPGRNNDVMGFAVAHASANDLLLQKNPTKYKTCETAFELTYSYQAFSNLSIQPNFQYILHPGMESQSKNAFVGTLRIQWNYN